MQPRYALIVGQGRSGTNWLLELFDQSPQTLCRNEPYGNAGSPLIDLFPHRAIRRRDQSELARVWDEAAARTARCRGERDPVDRRGKRYVHALSRALGLYRMVQGPRYRRALGGIIPSLRAAEWPLPRWIYDSRRLADALAVLKLNQAPGWTSFVLRERTDVPVFHIVRHPGGFLNSWAVRYLATRSAAQVEAENRERLRDLAAEDAEWAERLGDIGGLRVDEAELWYWRYANETIWACGRERPAYHRTIYEALAAEPIPRMRELFDAAGLEWNRDIESAIRQRCTDSPAIASNWRDRLSPERVDRVERILEASPMRDWWS